MNPVEDEVTAPWWAATRERRLLVQRCRDCGAYQHYPRALCTACASTDLEFVPASGRGTVYSHTTVHRAPDPEFPAPYVVALVRLDEGPVLMTNLLDDAGCDEPVVVEWRPLDDGRHLPVFRKGGP